MPELLNKPKGLRTRDRSAFNELVANQRRALGRTARHVPYLPRQFQRGASSSESYARLATPFRPADLQLLAYAIAATRCNIPRYLPDGTDTMSPVRRLLAWGVLEVRRNRANVPGWYTVTAYGLGYYQYLASCS